MPPTNTPQINFNIVTFSFFHFLRVSGILPDKLPPDCQTGKLCGNPKALLAGIVYSSAPVSLFRVSEDLLVEKALAFFILSVHKSRKFHTSIHTLCIVHFHQLPYILHLPDNTFDNFHTAPYSFLLTLSQQ